MKVRNGFVSNSSSSSFIFINTDDKSLVLRDPSDGDEEEFDYIVNGDFDRTDNFSFPIDDLIEKLQKAKAGGAVSLEIECFAGHNG